MPASERDVEGLQSDVGGVVVGLGADAQFGAQGGGGGDVERELHDAASAPAVTGSIMAQDSVSGRVSPLGGELGQARVRWRR